MSRREPTGDAHGGPLRGLDYRWQRVAGRIDAATLIAAVVVIAPLAIGGVHLQVAAPLAALACLALVRLGSGRERELQLGLVGLGLLLALLWTFVQWLPLPALVVGVLSPGAADAARQAAQAMGIEPPSWLPLSLDAPRTSAAWLNLAGLWAAFVVAANQRGTAGERRRLQLGVVLAALLVLAIGVIQPALGLDRIYGVYAASIPLRGRFQSPFVNTNHAATLMLLGACVAYGAWLGRSEAARGRWLLLAVGALTLGMVTAGSRSNAVLLPVALVGIAFVGVLRSPRGPTRVAVLRSLALVALLGVVGVLLFRLSPSWLVDMDSGWSLEGITGRWDVARAVAAENPWLGIGCGAFPTVSTLHTSADSFRSGYATFAHNSVLQAVSDWGLPWSLVIGALLFAGLAGAAWVHRRRIDRVAAAVALVAVFVENLVDFSVLIPGVGYATAVVAGWMVGAWHVPQGDATARARWWQRPLVRWSPLASVVLLAAFGATAYRAVLGDPVSAWSEVRDAIEEGQPERVDLAPLLMDHPSDFFLWNLAAVAADGRGDSALARRLAARALDLAPMEPHTIHVAARVEVQAGDVDAALVLLRRLADIEPVGLDLAVREVLSHGQVEGLADGFFRHDARLVTTAARLLRLAGQRDESERLLAWSLPVFPDALDLREDLASLWIHRPERRRQVDRFSIDMLARAATTTDPVEAARLKRAGYHIQGLLLRRDLRYREAWHMFEEVAALDPDRAAPALVRAGWTLVLLGDMARLATLLPRLAEAAGEDPESLSWHHFLAGHLAESEGDLRLAIRRTQSALVYGPGIERFRSRLATLYEQTGDSVSAQAVRAELARLRQPEAKRATAPPPSPPPAEPVTEGAER